MRLENSTKKELERLSLPDDVHVPNWIYKRISEWNSLKDSPRHYVKADKFNIPIRAFDTETLDGVCKLLACSDNNFLLNPTFDDILEFLWKYRGTLNFFWNIDYDIAAIIKLLPEKKIKQFVAQNFVLYYPFEDSLATISYAPRKFLTIAYKRKVVRFFDLWQFYHMSLDSASKRYLGESKYEMNREELGNEREYWEKNTQKIIEYCIRDCVLTQKLGELIQSKLNALGISFEFPVSAGSISAKYFSSLNYIRFKPSIWNFFAYMSYFGGRFEVVERGYFDDIKVYDINSAYPYAIAHLPSLKGNWYATTELDDNADLGFYAIVVRKSPDLPIQFFPYRNGVVSYPVLENTLHFCSLDELCYALDLGYEIDILKGIVFYAKEEDYPYYDTIYKLYDERNRVKDDVAMKLVLKLLMNSLYGKFAERQKKRKIVESVEEADEFAYMGDDIIFFKTYLKPGVYFNPVYAAQITALTRIKLFDYALKYDAVAMFTDCLFTSKTMESSDKLGDFKFEAEGEVLLVGSGVYTLRNINKGILKTRTRGTHLEKDIDLIDYAEKNVNARKIKLDWQKAIKPKEAFKQCKKYNLLDINRFIRYEREIDINFDRKRIWLNSPDKLGDLLNHTYESLPLEVGI
ncbi:MAG: DNA polymerase [Nitrososphaeria archaeon]